MSTGRNLTVHSVSQLEWGSIGPSFRDFTYEQSLTYSLPAAERIGAKAEFVVLKRDDRIVAAACLRIKTLPGLRRGIAWIAAGPLTQSLTGASEDLGDVLKTLRHYVCRQRGHILRLRLPVDTGLDPAEITALAVGAGFSETDRAAPYRTVLINLKQGEEALMRGLHGKWRNALRNALKRGISLDRGSMSELSGRFEALYNDVRSAKGFQPDIPPDFYYHLDGPDFDHDVLIARQGDEDLATITIGRSGGTLVYLFGATPKAGRRLNAGYFVMWHAILIGCSEGAATLDLGGVDEESNPDVARFKRRTGGVEVSAGGPFQAMPDGPIPRLILAAEGIRKRMRQTASR